MGKVLIIALIVIVVSTIIIFVLINNIYINYYTEKLAQPKIYCNGDVFKEGAENITEIDRDTVDFLFCTEYPDSKYVVYCKDDVPVITCRTTIFKKYFSR